MKLSLLTASNGDLGMRIANCDLCKGDHVAPVLVLEHPIRILDEHTTFPYRIRCPKTNLHILVKPPTSGDENWHIAAVRDTPSDLIPHIDPNAQKESEAASEP